MRPRRVRKLATALVVLLGLQLNACSDAKEPREEPEPDTNVQFAPSGGTFLGSDRVELTVAHPDAEIRFTLDGSVPGPSSTLYTGPLTLSESTRLCAVAVLPGTVPEVGHVRCEAYLRVAEDAAAFESHLPIVVIHTFETGSIDPQGREFVPAVLSLLTPSSGVTRLLGRATLDARIGIHVRGETSRMFAKKQYAIELREDADDDDLPVSLLGMPAEADWVLSDPVQFDRSSIRNALAYELSRRIGRYAPRTRFVEAFLVDDGGVIDDESYLGLFTLIEKIQRGSDRVDVERLEAVHVEEPEASGGYILRIDKGPVDFEVGGQRMQFVYPEPEVMRQPARATQLQYIRGYLDAFTDALAASDFKNDAGQHYSELIDVDAWIDHNILNAFTKNVDALRISAYFHKPRGGPLAAGPIWDFDRSLGTPQDERAREPAEWKKEGTDGTHYLEHGWWRRLFADPVFKARYRERFLALLRRELSVAEVHRVIDTLVAEIGPAAERNFRRWPETPPRQGSHAAEVTLLKDFVQRRSAWLQAQLMSWPVE